MSETVSAGAPSTPAQSTSSAQASSAPSTNPQTSAQSSNANAFGASAPATERKSADPNSFDAQSGDQATQTQPAGPRKLGAADLDALVEVKIDGKTQEMPLKEVIRLQQLEKASRQKMSEAQLERQRIAQERALAKSDPERYMREVLGVEPKTWAEERLAREYELQQMSPEAREAMELKQKLADVEAREARTREPLLNEIKQYVSPQVYEQILAEAPNATLEQIQNFAAQKKAEFQAGIDQTSNELLEAWEKTGLPRLKDFGQWMAQAMVDHSKKAAAHKKATGEDLPPLQAAEAAAKVKSRFLNSTRSLFSQMDAAAIQEALGPEIVQKLRTHDVEQVSKPATPPWASQKQATLPQLDPKKPYMTEQEFRKWYRGG